MSLFEQATREKWRFDGFGMLLAVEDLWTLRLTAKDPVNVPNLNSIAKALHKQLRNDDDVDFVNPEKKSDTTVQAKFDLVRYIIDTRLKEQHEEEQTQLKSAKRQQLLSILADKEMDEFKTMSKDDLRKAIEEL